MHNVEVGAWYALLASAATARAIIAVLNTEMTKVAAMPDYPQQLEKQAFVPHAGGPESFPAFIKAELAKWGRVIDGGNVKTLQ